MTTTNRASKAPQTAKKATPAKVAPAKKAPAPRKPRKATTALQVVKAETAKVEATPKPAMIFYRNGRPFPPSEQGQLHQCAWYCTANLDGDKPRISSKALIELMAKAGISDPKSSEWDLTLPNGQTISARFASGSKLPKPEAPVTETAKP